MPYSLRLAQLLRLAGWKVKIHDEERLEPPHITIYRKRRKWRVSLRTRRLLDSGDRWSQIDSEIRQAIEEHWAELVDAWDSIHPDNPVWSDNVDGQ